MCETSNVDLSSSKLAQETVDTMESFKNALLQNNCVLGTEQNLALQCNQFAYRQTSVASTQNVECQSLWHVSETLQRISNITFFCTEKLPINCSRHSLPFLGWPNEKLHTINGEEKSKLWQLIVVYRSCVAFISTLT